MKPDETRQTDSELFIRYMAGDEDVFRQIVNRYKDPLYAFLWRFLNRLDLVEDVFQDTFLQLYSSRESFDTTKPLRPWLFTIAANKARDALRKQQRTSAVSLGTMSGSEELSIDDILNVLASYEVTPYQDVEKDETASNVRQIIAQMPHNLKEILLLAYFEQFSYKQMAQILSIPIGTVKSRLHTAVASFTKMWKAQNQGDTNK